MGIKICYTIIYIIEAFIIWQYCSNLFEARFKKWVEGVSLTSFYTILFLISCLDNFWANVIAFITINFILIYVLFQIKWSTALFHTFIIVIIMGLSELFVISIDEYLATDFYNKTSNFYKIIILSAFSKLIYFLILQLISRLTTKQKELYSRESKSSIVLIFIPIISFWVMLTLFAICLYIKLPHIFGWMVTTSTIILLIINLLIFWIYNYNLKKSYEFIELQLQLQKEYDTVEYYKQLLKHDENQKIMIHDIRKHLQSIAILNEQGEQEKITAYINRLINSSDLRKTTRFCDNELLNAILCSYMRNCSEQNIEFRTDIRKNCVDFLADNDLTSLFCNLLDNAVESACKIPDSYIEFSAVCKENASVTLITMINSCRRNPYSLQSSSLISSKHNKKHHGFGMKSIQRIISKYNGDIQTYYDDNSKTFHTIIMIRK